MMKKNAKKRVSYTPARCTILHCVASQRLSLTSTSKAPLASMEAVLLLLGTDSIGTGRMASSSSLSSFESGIEVVER
jgi:hypothetical protein